MNKLKEKFAKFMYGRYGSDKLNLFMVIVLLVCAVINLFVRTGYFSVLLTSWEFLLLILIYLRMPCPRRSFRWPKPRGLMRTHGR